MTTMNMTTREQRYHFWRDSWKAGHIDEAAFRAAVEALAFQDDQGRNWMIDAATGRWYNPGQPVMEPAAVDVVHQPQLQPTAPRSPAQTEARFAALLSIPVKTIFVAGLALVVIMVLAWPVGSAPFAAPQVAPSPRPPLENAGGGGGGDGVAGSGSSRATRLSSINGTLVDLDTDLPGAGIEISVNGMVVRTDTDGSYSITGLPAGEYQLSPILYGQAQPAQGPVFVSVDGRSGATVDLAYFSQSQAIPTDTPQPLAMIVPDATVPPTVLAAVQATPPPDLPASGGSRTHLPLIVVGMGLFLALAGGLLLKWPIADEPAG